jgi:TPR repeat protein
MFVEQGNPIAQYSLGRCFEKGNGVEQNMETAVEWYRKAAADGNATAQFSLGRCFEKGTGAAQNMKSAVEWYTKAALQGNALAQGKLGRCYSKGLGVPQDIGAAVQWYTKAAGNQAMQPAAWAKEKTDRQATTRATTTPHQQQQH